MKKLLLSLLIFVLPVFAEPDAYTILDQARYVSTLNKTDLSGNLKKGSTSVPVKLFMRGKDIQMQYQADPNEAFRGIHLQLNNDSCELYDVVGSKMTAFPKDKVGQAIAGTDLTYEDLSLRFLYWPDPEVVGETSIKTQDCYIIRVFNPEMKGNYSSCDLYIHKKAAALMKVIAYDWKGKHIKTFQVSELMKVEDEYTMKKMKVETIKDGRTSSISYLIFDDPDPRKKPGNPRKLR